MTSISQLMGGFFSTSTAYGITNTLSTLALFAILGVVAAGTLLGIVYWWQYKHRLIVYELTDSRAAGYHYIKRCREYKDSEGQRRWVTLGLNGIDIPSPPAGFYAFTNRGAKMATCYLSDENAVWVRPDVKEQYYYQQLTQDEAEALEGATIENVEGLEDVEHLSLPADIRKKKLFGVKVGETTYLKGSSFFHRLDLFTGSQKYAHLSGFKAAMRRREDFWSKWAPVINMSVMVFMIMIGGIVMYKTFDKPLEMLDKASSLENTLQQHRLEYLQELDYVINNKDRPQLLEGQDVSVPGGGTS